MTFRPVTIEDGRVVEHRPDAEPRLYEVQFDGRPYSTEDRAWIMEHVAASDRSFDRSFILRYEATVRDLESRLAAAETALADRDRHFQWDERLRMEREIGDLATRLATAEADRDRWQARAEWCDTVRNSMDEPCYVPATRDYAGGWCIVGVRGFYATRWEAIDAAIGGAPTPGGTP